MKKKVEPWEMTVEEAAKELHMTTYDLRCRMRHCDINIGNAVQHEGKKGRDYRIYRKKVMELKEELGIP